jgi:hypothetical protein
MNTFIRQIYKIQLKYIYGSLSSLHFFAKTGDCFVIDDETRKFLIKYLN